jgi:hypothetical protein
VLGLATVRAKYDDGAVSAAIWNVICFLQADGRLPVLAQSPLSTPNVFGVLAILALTPALGYDSAQAIRSNPIPVNTILLTDGELSGRVIRMGERGVLFWQTGTRRLSLIRWDLVKEIATIDPPKK